jgi:orotidine-5'-phosphate decarboxylase
VVLDVDGAGDALRVVDQLGERVRFYKIGLQLFLGGEWTTVLRELADRRCEVFLDLKLPDDIGNTIRRAVETCVRARIVRFLTLSRHVSEATIRAAVQARGSSGHPRLLAVPMLSSADGGDLPQARGSEPQDVNRFIVTEGKRSLDAGCDGLIVSGAAIEEVKRRLRCLVVSPGIRPAGFGADDHKRSTTPGQAIRMGSDYLVVGRPIVDRPPQDRARVAQAIIDEIDAALDALPQGTPTPRP